MSFYRLQGDMGAVGLEPTETEVEGFTVVCLTKIHNLPQSLQQQPKQVTPYLQVVNYGICCRFLLVNVPPLSHEHLSRSDCPFRKAKEGISSQKLQYCT